MKKILVIGAGGQIGSELVLALRKRFGVDSVIASDVKPECPAVINDGVYSQLDILNKVEVRKFIIEQSVTEVYLLAALLSATAEKNPDFAWKLNMEGLFTILDLAKLIGQKLNKDVVTPELTNELVGNPKVVNISTEKYKNEFNKTSFISLEDGIINTINWQKELYGKNK